MRNLLLRHWYPSIVGETEYIETRSFGKVWIGYEMKWRIDAAKTKLGKVL